MVLPAQELDSGVVLQQVTDGPPLSDNIYCERSYCSPDSRYFVFKRFRDAPAPDPIEYVACDFGTWAMEPLGRGCGPCDITRDGRFYYVRPGRNAGMELACVDLQTGRAEAIRLPPEAKPAGAMSVSRDGRYVAWGRAVSFDPQMFAIQVLDLSTGACEILFQDPWICNPHTQFEPAGGRQLLIQHNRGCQFDRQGRRLALLGEAGCTLLVLSVPDGRRHPLQVGPPYTRSATGHEQWIADTGDVLCSVDAPWAEAFDRGNLLRVRPGEPARRVARGFNFMHVHASVCGRYFCADVLETADLKHGYVLTDRPEIVCHVIVGSLTTGRHRVLYSYAYDYNTFHRQYGQSSHAHPYLSPDGRWAVFNCCRTGRPEVHVASIPAAMLRDL